MGWRGSRLPPSLTCLLVGRLWVLLVSLLVAPVLLLFPLLGRLSLTIQVPVLVIPFLTLQGGGGPRHLLYRPGRGPVNGRHQQLSTYSR